MAKHSIHHILFISGQDINLGLLGRETGNGSGSMQVIGIIFTEQKLLLESNAILWWINNCTNRMRYAKKVRLALALLIKMVAMVAEVLWWNLDS